MPQEHATVHPPADEDGPDANPIEHALPLFAGSQSDCVRLGL